MERLSINKLKVSKSSHIIGRPKLDAKTKRRQVLRFAYKNKTSSGKRAVHILTSESTDSENNLKQKYQIHKKKLPLDSSLNEAEILYIETKPCNGEKSKLLVCNQISINSTEWLDLVHIDSFQSLLLVFFPDINGLCDPTIYSYGQYKQYIGKKESIFIQ